ncbi:MMPL family protein [Maioricimonas rarisocia]|uniref:MMPL family protein n=1 Tax=Maioricimonas rarisocia TaxID=2528026 RepID=A0A517ZG82_9PLAN|nr:MMPL family transporter [Maioricimonas rarisocia]QDU41452.1 MMPL family protein [Maioricimonas rarisocia]
MKNLFPKRDPWRDGLALWIIAGLVFALPLLGSALKGLALDNNIETWLPKDDPEARIYAWYEEHFPNEEHVIVTWEGSSLDDPRVLQFERRLEGQVDEDGVRRGGDPYVEKVTSPRDVLQRMVRYGIDSEDATSRLEGVLIGAGGLKVQLTDAGREQQDRVIRRLTDRAREELGLEIEIRESALAWRDQIDWEAYEEDEYATSDADDEDAEPVVLDIPAHDFEVTWQGINVTSENAVRFLELAANLRGKETAAEPTGRKLVQSCFVAPGSPLAVVVTLSEAGDADKRAAIATIQNAALASGIEPEKLHLGGRPVTSAALNGAVLKSAWNKDAPLWQFHNRSLILLSGAIGMAFSFMFLRDIRLGLLVVGVSYYATIFGVAIVPISGSPMNMVLIVMPTLLLVLALSGAIHVANYWKHAACEDPETAVQKAISMARQPCAMASITTAIGLLSLLTSNLTPVRQFGGYSAAGCLVALGMVLYALPSLLHLSRPRPPKLSQLNPRRWHYLGAVLCRYPNVIAGSCALFFVGASLGLIWFRTETKVVRYFPDDSQLVQDYRFLEENLAHIAPIETVIRFTPESQQRLRFLERMEVIRAVEDQIRQHPEISGTLSLADFQPVREAPGDDASVRQKIFYNRRSSEAERRIKEEQEGGAAQFLAVSRPHPDVGEENAMLTADGHELWRVTAQAAVMSDADYGVLTRELDERIRSVLRYHAGADHVVTGAVPLFLRTQQAVLSSLVTSFGLAFVIIGAVMILVLRNPLAGALSMLPNLFPVGVVFGLLSWSGQRTDIGTMITASVALGIAVDGTLHLLTWFRDGLQQGMSRQRAVMAGLAHCGPAMWQTSAAVGVGLLVLFPSELLLISRFGWLMASLIAGALVADVILLPALLVGPLGALIERDIIRARPPKAEKPPQVPSPQAIPAPHILAGPRRGGSPFVGSTGNESGFGGEPPL